MLLRGLKHLRRNAFSLHIAPFIDLYSTVYRLFDTNKNICCYSKNYLFGVLCLGW